MPTTQIRAGRLGATPQIVKHRVIACLRREQRDRVLGLTPIRAKTATTRTLSKRAQRDAPGTELCALETTPIRVKIAKILTSRKPAQRAVIGMEIQAVAKPWRAAFLQTTRLPAKTRDATFTKLTAAIVDRCSRRLRRPLRRRSPATAWRRPNVLGPASGS